MSKKNWSSRLSFIITSAAFAVGLGNVWRFPYIAGEGGGGAFLLVYLLLVFLVGIPILMIEIGLGRMAQATPLIGYGKISGRPVWNGLGWLNIIASLLIMSYYVMIMAWIAIYFYESLSGHLANLKTEDLPGHFETIASNLDAVIIVILGIMLLASLIVSRGLQSGLERYAKGMMIGLIVMLLGLAVWAATLDGAAEGYHWFLFPDFSKITFEVIMSALGQLFFSVGVGMAVAFAFGSYTKKDENLITSTVWIVLADTFFAILAGLLIFPAIFSFGLTPDSGPNLIFVTMASVFGKLEFGSWIGGIFFLLLYLAGFTSMISVIQGLKDSLVDKYQLSDLKGLLLVSGIVIVLAVPVVFSYSDSSFQIFGMTVFGLLDYLTNTIMLPLGGLLIAVFAAFIIGFEKLKTHIQVGAENIKIGGYWKIIIQWVIPLAVLIILLNGVL